MYTRLAKQKPPTRCENSCDPPPELNQHCSIEIGTEFAHARTHARTPQKKEERERDRSHGIPTTVPPQESIYPSITTHDEIKSTEHLPAAQIADQDGWISPAAQPIEEEEFCSVVDPRESRNTAQPCERAPPESRPSSCH